MNLKIRYSVFDIKIFDNQSNRSKIRKTVVLGRKF